MHHQVLFWSKVFAEALAVASQTSNYSQCFQVLAPSYASFQCKVVRSTHDRDDDREPSS